MRTNRDRWSDPRSCGHSSRPYRNSRDATRVGWGERLQPSGRSSTLMRAGRLRGRSS
ncbi:unnamed protein product [Ectocarpus sp. 4 AP-2014]